ncbi:MAG: EAL domain-containing protein [Acetatifactor sp.]|nr:EAL domain-containing protein [Acetatifactor sp.]
MDEKRMQNPWVRRSVLVVDDEAFNRQILGDILNQDYEVIYAKNGEEALSQIHTLKERLSLVLLDLIMPVKDGFEVLNDLYSEGLLSQIPVIVLTAEKSAEIKSLQMGAADFLSKPYDSPEVIMARVNHAIKLFEDSNIIRATERDALTGLYTKEFFFEYGHQFDQYHPELAMDAVVINFNHFHLLNELYGRAFGDKVLCTVADGIRDIISGSCGIACRYDADTFYLYVAHQTDTNQLPDYILSCLSKILEAPQMRIRMGLYSDSYRATPLEERFDRALQACKSIRNQHSIAVAVYDMDMHEKEVYKAKLLEEFESAIENKNFKVLYQPKYNIAGEEPVLCGAEALVCWEHPEFGRMRPSLFIPLFEENGLVQKLDRYVWREVASQMKKWRDENNVTIPISVNVSRVDIYDPGIAEFLLGLMNEYGIDTSDYLLEITESAYTDNSKQIVDVVNKLRAEGFRVEMDDFGSGYSSLNMLTTLPIDALKLDMEFIQNIAVNHKDLRMVELVLEIADFLGVPVVAEGVETAEQHELLRKAGCSVIQGFYFSKPISAEEFGRLIVWERSAD